MAFAIPVLITAAKAVAVSLIVAALNRTDTEGPRLDDLNVQRSEFGRNIPIHYGNGRLAGNLIQLSEPLETKKKKKKKKLGIVTIASFTSFTYSVDMAILIAAGELPSTASIGRIWANGDIIFDSTSNNPDATAGSPIISIGSPSQEVGTRWTRTNNTHTLMDEIRFYRGTHDQDPDASLEAIEGVGKVSGYHGTAYIVFDTLQLTQEFNNRIPNIEIELIDTAPVTLEEIVEDIGNRVGIEIYANPLRPTLVTGYTISNAGQAWTALAPLAGVFSFDLISNRSRMEAVPRGGELFIHIPNEDLAGRVAGPGVQSTKSLSRDDVLDLPKEVVVTYLDQDRDYQKNAQRSFRDQGVSTNKITIEVPITMNADTARSATDALLWEATAASRKASVSVSRLFERTLKATDIISLDIGNERRAFRIERVQKGRNGVIKLDTVFEDPLVYQSTSIGTTGTFASGTVSLPGQSTLHPMDTSIVDNLDNTAGMYFAISAPNAGWRSAVIDRSVDGGLSFDEVAEVVFTSVVGNVSGTLPIARSDVFDEGSTLTVILIRDDDILSTVTDIDIFNGDNIAWVGSADGTFGEWIQFRDAVATATPREFILTGLLRGRFGTEHAIADHQAAEIFVLHEGDAVGRSEFPASEWNKIRKWRAVSSFTDSVDAAIIDVSNTGEGKRPLSGVSLQAHRDQGNNDIRISWIRRSRLTSPTLGGGLTPIGEETESYEIDVFDGIGGGALVIRTETITNSQFIYTETQQTIDGHTLGDPVKISIFQMSTIRGRGRPLEGIV